MADLPSAALGGWLMIAGETGANFNWEGIKKCAAEPLPAPPTEAETTEGGIKFGMASHAWKEMEMKWQNIQFCRNALAARHEGWVAAAPDRPDPLPPEPMMRPDDMKR